MQNPSSIDAVLRRVNREAWVVTSSCGPRRGGLVATWVSEASIDRQNPTMLIGIAPNHFTAELIDASRQFTLHLLRPDQVAMALNFASDSGRDRDKLADVSLSEASPPRLADCAAWLRCEVFARLATGDRTYYWADVVYGQNQSDGPCLREAELIAAASDAQRQRLADNRAEDIQIHRPLLASWRANLPEFLRP